jgi:hypothetical protein
MLGVCGCFLADAVRRYVKVAKAVLGALYVLSEDASDPPEKSPNPDWLFRWRDAAAGVSASDLQTLWGKLLAGEVKQPCCGCNISGLSQVLRRSP